MADNCAACGGVGTVTTDPLSGLYCCCDCGVVVDDDSLAADHQVGLVCERGGTLVCGDGVAISDKRFQLPGADRHGQYLAKKKMDSLQRVRELASNLRLQPNDADQVEAMVDRATNGGWGGGRWFTILTGACAYVVVRQNRLPLTLVEVAYSADCGVPELGQVVIKLLKELEVSLPPEDPIVFVERLVLSNSKFAKVGRDGTRKIIAQCRVLLEWMPSWFVTTGRHILPAAAAVLAIVAEANRVEIELSDISVELHAPVTTSMKRFREIQAALVKTIKTLPGCDRNTITTKNISLHLCFMLRYLEVSIKLDKKRKRDATAAKIEDQDPARKNPKKIKQENLKHVPEASPVLPRSFEASRSSRCARMIKTEMAAQRIASAKRRLAGGGSGGDDRKLKGLDGEDLMIEGLLLRGATREQIEQGYYDSVLVDLMPSDEQEPIRDEELEQYFYSKDEASQIAQQLKLQSILKDKLLFVN